MPGDTALVDPLQYIFDIVADLLLFFCCCKKSPGDLVSTNLV